MVLKQIQNSVFMQHSCNRFLRCIACYPELHRSAGMRLHRDSLRDRGAPKTRWVLYFLCLSGLFSLGMALYGTVNVLWLKEAR